MEEWNEGVELQDGGVSHCGEVVKRKYDNILKSKNLPKPEGDLIRC
jgi:hypothetical protein